MTGQYPIYTVEGLEPEVSTVHEAAEAGDVKLMQKLMGGGKAGGNFDPNTRDRHGRTPIVWAAEAGHIDAVELLIRMGANVDAADMHTNRTAMHWAARAGHLEIVQFLRDNGADVNKEDKWGLTPVYLAKQKGADAESVFKFLLGAGANYNDMTASAIPKHDPALTQPQTVTADT
eukprot:jgi/Chlat1/4019/Chrsp26S03996